MIPSPEESREQAAQAQSFVVHPTWHDLCIYMDELILQSENDLLAAKGEEREEALAKWQTVKELLGDRGKIRLYPQQIIEGGTK
jgi:hypothetical protein